MTIIYAVILFAILIFPHELGHFLVAKAVGVKVNEFAFGMGPAIFKKQGKETLYAIRIFPIGGYCAMEGENEESDSSRAFNNKPMWAKIAVLLAGSAMNVVIAIITLSIIMGIAGSATTTIDTVQNNSPALEAGIQSGDEIISIDGNSVEKWSDLTTYLTTKDSKVEVGLLRDGTELTLVSETRKADDGTDRYVIGITPKISHNVFTAAGNGCKSAWNMTKTMYYSIKMLVAGEVSTKEITGPVGMVTLVSDTSKYGLGYFASLLALISLNLAIVNMLPLPALDGGRILFVIIRRITGKMISDQLEGTIHGAGLILLFGFMIFVTWNDITRLI